MKAVHISDTHGTFPELPKDAELVLHTGDFCPNFMRWGMFTYEADDQSSWLRVHRDKIRSWLADRPMFVVQGNHDFVSPMECGASTVVDVTNKHIGFRGNKFYGFPYVPMFGPWNWGLNTRDMSVVVNDIPTSIEVLMCHAPPHGILDGCSGGNIGNEHLLAHLDSLPELPKYLLCGHVHEQGGGVANHRGMTIVNSATTMRMIDI